ncbi:MAG TPA: histone deacetylase [Solirubrobacteraceae bacterium]|jgi:acetoin utilization deacetylase AcuC-like enzyme
MTSVFLEHPSSLEHETGRHPEQPARITAIQRACSDRGWLGFERMESPAVDLELLTQVHSRAHVDTIRELAARGGGALDLDTVMSEGSYTAALHAAGGAARLVELLLGKQARYGFSAHRPPGHHATADRAMGFCLFNSVAVAATSALREGGLSRVLILDWDVHHGNGTNDIFHSTDQVLFISIHQWPFYPGSGGADDLGSGAGLGHTVNLPVPAGSGDAVFCSLVDHVAMPLAMAFQPDLVLISAGYDAHQDDTLGQCAVTDRGFAAMTRSVVRTCAALDAPLGCVLEGGYGLDALGRSVAVTMEVMAEAERSGASDGDRAAESAPVPLARQALERLQPFWPTLAADRGSSTARR